MQPSRRAHGGLLPIVPFVTRTIALWRDHPRPTALLPVSVAWESWEGKPTARLALLPHKVANS